MLQFDKEAITWMCNDLQKICQIVSDIVKKKKKKKKPSKIHIVKLLKDQKILKNQMIHCLGIIETKQNVYD